MNKLRHCPFCGSDTKIIEDSTELPFSEERTDFGVVCEGCGCSPFWFEEVNLYYKQDAKERAKKLKEKAIEKWNSRVEEGKYETDRQ